MKDSKIIAEWLKIPVYTTIPGGRAVIDDVYIFNDGDRMTLMTAQPERVDNRPIYYDPYIWSPSEDITLWYGKDGIISKIITKGVGRLFVDILLEQSVCAGSRIDCALVGLTSTAAQLSAALVTMISEQE